MNVKKILHLAAVGCLCLVVFDGRCLGQLTVHEDPQESAKPAVTSTISKGGTLAGGASGGTLSTTAGFGSQNTISRITSGQITQKTREGGEFVGRDAEAGGSFVGLKQADQSGPIRSAISGLRIEQTPEANVRQQAATERRNAIYDPRLVVAFEVTRKQPQEAQTDLRRRLLESPNFRWAGPVEVAVRGDTAVLTGEAASPRDREMAELVLLLEPGIDKVDNQLTVRRR